MPSAAEIDALASFGPATRRWFDKSFSGPTQVQARGWQRIAAGEHSLLLAPTGSGKTLAAFLWCLDRLMAREPADRDGGVRVLYVSPLKALAYDVERNLRAPLVGIQQVARQLGEQLVPPRVAIRSGDTTQQQRRAWAREPGEILVTTPESLYLILGSQARACLRTVETVIVDEVHALAYSKRGAHLALSLERLAAMCPADPQRIGLSATAQPLDEVARYLGGDRPVAIVDTSAAPKLDLQVVVPVPDMTHPERIRFEPERIGFEPPSTPPQIEAPPPGPVDDLDEAAAIAALSGSAAGQTPQHGIWPVIVPQLVSLIRQHRTTIIFVNSRGLCERLVQRIADSDDPPLVRAHHGSLSHGHRREVEELLKTGKIAGIVATSSLELGIDMGMVDLVILVESPGAVSRGLQRVGRAGHGVGEISKGRMFPKHRGDLLETTVVAKRMRSAELEPLVVPDSPLDVLAQQIVAMCSLEARPVAEVERVVRRAANYQRLPHSAFVAVLDMLSGRYPSTDFTDLRPRLVWDRDRDSLAPRAGARMLAILSGGTIPDRGLYGVYLGADGPRVGELDEEMVHESQPGHVITLGASSWRIEEITRDRVVVSPAPGEVGRMPFWRGEGPGRPIELGRAIGEFLRDVEERLDRADAARRKGQSTAQSTAQPTAEPVPDPVQGWLQDAYALDAYAAENLLCYLREQREACGALPSDRRITVERFRDELGDHRICILTPFGARVHAPWALALMQRFSRARGYESQLMWSDDGICLRLADADELPDLDALFPDPDDVEPAVLDQLGDSALFASHFRENAARALLLPRRRPGSRTPLWQQRLKSQQLLAVARGFPSFPIVVETYRQCLKDVFDMPSLVQLLSSVRKRQIRVDEADTLTPSPFARSLVFAYVAAYLYEGDAPLAERRAQALSLDKNLLRELLGQEELYELLDRDVIEQLEAELQLLVDDRRVRGVDGVHDLLRRLGALEVEPIAARSEGDAAALLDELARARRVIRVPIAGAAMWLAVEDAALYRDALGAVPPHGVPDAFLEPVEHALEALVARWARTHGPFLASGLATRHGIARGAVESALRVLETEGRVVHGAFLRGGAESEWCDSEVLRRIKRRTLAKLRGEVEPVERAVFARFLPAWHGIDQPGKGLGRLEEAIVQLEGMPLSYAELNRSILPARVRDYSPRMLDELGAIGFVVWVGCGALGARDGKVALFRRERVAKLLDPPELGEEATPLARALHTELGLRGACFFADLLAAVEANAELAEAGASPRREAIAEALWDLVWAGLVTNDTFQPLRALSMRGSSRSGGRRGTDLKTAGRWSLVAPLIGAGTSPTERAHARALMLLERHAIVSRDAVSLEAFPGGFSGVYPILRGMEDAGKLRRGYFVEGIGGAQFALAGAVDRLRGMRAPASLPLVTVLSASDPANPYGWILPWPDTAATTTRQPKRATGALVVLVDGEATLYLERGGRTLLCFAGVDREALIRALEGLRQRLARYSHKSLRIDEIDGQPALSSPWAAAIKEHGIEFDHKGFVIEREV